MPCRSMQSASLSSMSSLSLRLSLRLSATPRRPRHGRTCAKYLDVSFYFDAGAARVGGSSLICALSAWQQQRERGSESEREREGRLKERSIERVCARGRQAACVSLEICAKGTRVFRAGLRFGLRFGLHCRCR